MSIVHTATGPLHYEVFDATAPWHAPAETILFQHGIGAHPGIWSEWLPALVDRYRIVRFDMRGSGRSHIPPKGFDWSLRLLADDLLAVADATGTPRFHVVGESMGGTIALQVALDRPERIASLTISNGADVGSPIRRVQEWARQMDEGGVAAWSEGMMADRFHPGALDGPKRDWYAMQQSAWTRDAILDALQVLRDTNLRARLPEVNCPVLLMHGDGSPFIPVGVMAEMHAALPDSRLQVFAHAKHGLPFSHARECGATLRSFLDGTTKGGRPG